MPFMLDGMRSVDLRSEDASSLARLVQGIRGENFRPPIHVPPASDAPGLGERHAHWPPTDPSRHPKADPGVDWTAPCTESTQPRGIWPTPDVLGPLADFLGRAFSPKELRLELLDRYFPGVARGAGASRDAPAVVALLNRKGLIDRRFFAVLRGSRPALTTEIDAVADRLGFASDTLLIADLIVPVGVGLEQVQLALEELLASAYPRVELRVRRGSVRAYLRGSQFDIESLRERIGRSGHRLGPFEAASVAVFHGGSVNEAWPRDSLSHDALAAGPPSEAQRKAVASDELAAGRPPRRLSKVAREIITLVAFRQPITLGEISEIRGADSGGCLRMLVDRGLIRTCGRSDLPGRPILYGTTPRFLEHFGLRSLADLPTLRDFHDMRDDPGRPPLELSEEVSDGQTVSEAEGSDNGGG